MRFDTEFQMIVVERHMSRYLAISWREQVTGTFDDNDVHFVLYY
jgi:hypothetical protein